MHQNPQVMVNTCEDGGLREEDGVLNVGTESHCIVRLAASV